MTGPGRDDIRDTLEAALIVWWAETGDVDVEEVRAVNGGAAEAYADELLPVVRRIAADELRAAAEAARGMHDPPAPDCVEWADWLQARAAALDPR